MCVSGCGKEESASHLFLHCHVFGSLWQHIRSWIGVTGVDTNNISEHFNQFIHYTGYSKARCSFLQLLWLLCVWLVWNERNNRLFKNTETPIEQLLDKVKFHSLWWLKANKATFVYGSQSWWSNPLHCLGIDWLVFVILHLWQFVLPGWNCSTPCTEEFPAPMLIYFHFDFFKKNNQNPWIMELPNCPS